MVFMIKLKLKGHHIEGVATKDSFNRRALQFKNRIIYALQKVGVKKDDIDVPLEIMAGKKAKASVTWYANKHRMYYSCSTQGKFVDNLQVISKIIERETGLVDLGEKTLQEFYAEFEEDDDVEEKRVLAREFLGVEEESNDIEAINKKYKKMAKELHPDTPTGNTEKFKKLNNAHKILKRELM